MKQRAAATVTLLLLSGCVERCSPSTAAGSDGGGADAQTVVTAPSVTTPGAPRPGMAWIPQGELLSGTPVDALPRVAGDEPPGVPVSMSGFYIDIFPFPNEQGAIPLTNVTRDEAAAHCARVDKRLCTELEWERACKGPDNTVYETGNQYQDGACGGNSPLDNAARRPSGDRPSCVSRFGVRDMHGGPLEWTASDFGRGSPGATGAVRGGGGPVGEVTGRCAAVRAHPVGKRDARVGFRCCRGPVNAATVVLSKGQFSATYFGSAKDTEAPAELRTVGCHANPKSLEPDEAQGEPCDRLTYHRWKPAPNVEFMLRAGCNKKPRPERECSLLVARLENGRAFFAGSVPTGTEHPELALVGPESARKVRVKGGRKGTYYHHDLVFSFGRVQIQVAK